VAEVAAASVCGGDMLVMTFRRDNTAALLRLGEMTFRNKKTRALTTVPPFDAWEGRITPEG